MISTKAIPDFTPVFEVASCFVERDGEILLLLRAPSKTEVNKWGVPAGKVEKDETPVAAIIREIGEEIGVMTLDSLPRLFETYYIRFPEYDFVYHVFHMALSSQAVITISAREHQEFRWTTPGAALNFDLVRHQDDCIKLFYFR